MSLEPSKKGIEFFMASSFFKSFSVIFTFLILLVLIICCFFGPTILGNTYVPFEGEYDSIYLDGEYVWPTPRLYYH